VILAIPAATPQAKPEVLLTVTIELLPLVQVPPEVEELSIVQLPGHNAAAPAIGAGNGLTVIVPVRAQPVGNVYVISAVQGAVIPVTEPDVAPMLTQVLPVLHEPPAGALLTVIELP
jgi:hypothetical protein